MQIYIRIALEMTLEVPFDLRRHPLYNPGDRANWLGRRENLEAEQL